MKKIKSFAELNDLFKGECQDNSFGAFVNSDRANRKRILSEYGIEYNSEYVGRYNINTGKVIFENIKNPFTGGILSARLIKWKKPIRNGENIKVILTSLKSRSGDNSGLNPENIFVCKITDITQFENRMDNGGLPVYTKKEIEEEKRRVEEHIVQLKIRREKEKKAAEEERRQAMRQWLNERNRELKANIEKRKIRWLVHFTRTDNLESILDKGICTLDTLEKIGIEFFANDEYRWDHCTDCVNVTIEFPNSWTLKSYMANSPGTDWIMLFLNPELLYEQENYYAYHNASTGEINRNIRNMNKNEDFENMFADRVVVAKASGEQRVFDRFQIKEHDYLPTSDQAEILIRGSIDSKFIVGIAFSSKVEFRRLENDKRFEGIEMFYNPDIFKNHRYQYIFEKR